MTSVWSGPCRSLRSRRTSACLADKGEVDYRGGRKEGGGNKGAMTSVWSGPCRSSRSRHASACLAEKGEGDYRGGEKGGGGDKGAMTSVWSGSSRSRRARARLVRGKSAPRGIKAMRHAQ
eukprot:360146-Chlamydomonas_euryale.AAC.2